MSPKREIKIKKLGHFGGFQLPEMRENMVKFSDFYTWFLHYN
jgi:hypothetical protein